MQRLGAFAERQVDDHRDDAAGGPDRRHDVADLAVRVGRLVGQREAAGIEVVLRPLCPGQRPLVLVPLDEPLTRVPDLEQDRWLGAPAGVLTLEEVVEELLLQRHALASIHR